MSADPLRDLYKTLTGRGALPLEPDDPYYVPILQALGSRGLLRYAVAKLNAASSHRPWP